MVSVRAILPPMGQTILLLTLSNVFMTFAWYAHLRNLAERPWWIAAMASWVVFVPFAWFYMRQPLRLDYLWAALCILGAVYFVFRNPQ